MNNKNDELNHVITELLHDIVNPLTSIVLNLENLKNESGDPKINLRIDRALHNVMHIKDIITAGRSQIEDIQK